MTEIKKLNLRDIIQDCKPKGYQANTPEIAFRRYDSVNERREVPSIGNMNYGFMQSYSRKKNEDLDYSKNNKRYAA